jgi:hypothetical protein
VNTDGYIDKQELRELTVYMTEKMSLKSLKSLRIINGSLSFKQNLGPNMQYFA